MIITVDPSQSEDIAAFAMVKQYRMQALNVTLNGGTGSSAWQAVQGGEGYTQTVVTPVTGIELVYDDPNAIVSYTVENDDTSNYDVASDAGIILSSIEPTDNAWTYTCVFHADSVPVSSVDIDLLVYGNIARGTEQQGSPATAEEITAQVLSGLETRVTALEEEMPDKADVATTYTKAETDTLLAGKADTATTYTKTDTDALLALKADQATTYTKAETDTLLGAKADDNAVVHLEGAETIPGAKTFSNVINAENFIRSKHKVLNSYSISVSLGRWVPIYTITKSGQSVPQASFYIALRKNGYAIIQIIDPPSGSLTIQGMVVGSARAPENLFRVSAEDSTTWTLWVYLATDDGIRADCLGAYGSNTQLNGSNITPLSVTTGYTITSEGYTDENGTVHTFTAYAEMKGIMVGTGHVTVPFRAYSAGNTNDVATIATLDSYSPMVRTTGNQEITGVKSFRANMVLKSESIDDTVHPVSGYIEYPNLQINDKNDQRAASIFKVRNGDLNILRIGNVYNYNGARQRTYLNAQVDESTGLIIWYVEWGDGTSTEIARKQL